MIVLLTIFCFILFGALVVKHAEAQYWKRRYLNYAGLDESDLVTEDVREYYLMNREECENSNSSGN